MDRDGHRGRNTMQSLMHFLKWSLGAEPAAAWTRSEERDCLARYAAGKKRLAEIGVWEGATTSRLRSVMASDAILYAIDPYPPGRLGLNYQRLIAFGEVARVRNGAVVWIRKTGAAAARDAIVTSRPFDFVFVDADHTYEGLRLDWEAWSPLISPRGIVALHDSILAPGNTEPGSARYANEVIVSDRRFETVEAVHSVRVLRRMSS
jgi:predicted O-methyltransferase YrrM